MYIPYQYGRLVRYVGIALLITLFAVWGTVAYRNAGSYKHLQDTLSIESTAFANGSFNLAYTCHGAGTSIPVSIKNLPAGTKSLAFLLQDSSGKTYWNIWNIRPVALSLKSGVQPEGTVGRTSSGDFRYSPPCPAKKQTLHLTLTVYVLNVSAMLSSTADVPTFQKAANKYSIVQKTITGDSSF